MRLSLLLDLAADTLPDRTAIDGSAGSLTYRELHDTARALAAHLAMRPGKAVGYLGMNAPAVPVALFGAAMAGRPFAPINYRLTDEQLRRLAGRLAPATIVADDAMAARIDGIDGIDLLPASALATLDPAPAGWTESEEADETAVLLFTSGTSGEPKAARLTHANLTAYVMQTVEFLSSDEDEAAIVSVPPYHIAGISALLTGIYAGRRIVQMPGFDAVGWADSVRRYGVTQAMVVPTMLARILDAAGDAPLSSLRSLAYGGGKMPLPVIRRALALWPDVAFTNAYGLTETSSTIAVLGPDDHALARTGDPRAAARLNSVGRPLPSVTIEVRDEAGMPCGIDQPGEIWVRGEQVSGAYADRPTEPGDGWFATRDRGWFDADGYLYIDGRLDDVIVRGGENLSPGEIEAVLREHPAIADAAVVGAPCEQWGEKVVAFIVTAPGCALTDEELRHWVSDRLRSTRAPELFYRRDDLPYNDLGKMLRRVLRDELASIPAA